MILCKNIYGHNFQKKKERMDPLIAIFYIRRDDINSRVNFA